AEAARLIAEHTGIIDADDAYTLGLLHDVGEFLFRALFREEVEGMQDIEEGARIEREVTAFGVDHAQVGQWVLEACGVPRALTAVVQTHHDVMRINAPAALLLHVVNAIAHADNPHKVAALDELGSDRLAMLRLGRADLANIHARTAERIESHLANV
ncbi:MAG: HDOD domain-containing protein, partial [Acidobacteria bacterium]|nr:HDOD domain-containing protein [Acidobacteriota bacterium]